jgi:GAF domain-containing protein
MIGRTLYDVTQLLESADGAGARVRRVLELLADLVPYQQCAMLEAQLGHHPDVVLVPDTGPGDRAVLTRTLVEIFGQLVDPDAPPRRAAGRPDEAHLAVPLVGLDEVIGILLVRSSVTDYTEEHLCTLSVVAAKLAAYFTIRRATAEISELARERDEARSAVQAARRAKDELLALLASSERKLPARSTSSGAIEELERRIQVQAQRLDDLLGQARVESGELCQNLRAVSSALAGEDPSSPDSRTRSGQG